MCVCVCVCLCVYILYAYSHEYFFLHIHVCMCVCLKVCASVCVIWPVFVCLLCFPGYDIEGKLTEVPYSPHNNTHRNNYSKNINRK